MTEKSQAFARHITEGYRSKGDSIVLGTAMLNAEPIAEAQVAIPLKTLNRHGLITGATGTGKTKTIQVLCEQLSKKGIPVLMMDIKGDFSGIAQTGVRNSFIEDRYAKMKLDYEPQAFPTELLTISEQLGVRLRATISEFGPVLFSRILDLNDVQSGVVSLVFKYCDDHHLPLLDLKDIKKTLHYLSGPGKTEIEKEYGKISGASIGTIIRKIVELEQQNADLFFGERSFEISDLMRIDEHGRGYVNILRLTDIQDKPKLFSTFMLSLLAEVYEYMPEQGDTTQPELVFFIDEAHLIFSQASKTLRDQIETIVKLIRSKGIGIYFITQNPTDIPASVLAQLGLKISHALRAFTANDRKAIKQTAENYPLSEFYKTDEVLTSLGIGEALVTALNEKGIPTPLAATMLRSPESRMDILTPAEIQTLVSSSKLAAKYNQNIDRESAFEILSAKIHRAEETAAENARTTSSKQPSRKNDSPVTKSVIKVLTSATFLRGMFGVLNKMLRRK